MGVGVGSSEGFDVCKEVGASLGAEVVGKLVGDSEGEKLDGK